MKDWILARHQRPAWILGGVLLATCAPQPMLIGSPAQQAWVTTTQACDRGDAVACFDAGMLARQWEGRAPGALEMADGHFRRGCDLGHADSCRQVALRWVGLRPEVAIGYLRRACELGEVTSCADLAVGEPSREPPARHSHRKADPPPPAADATVVSGTCFFAAKAGIAITNHHVVDGATKIAVIDARGRVHAATVVRDDPTVDLAVLESVTARDIAPLPLAGDSDLSLGEPVFTIGFPVPGVLGDDPKFSEGSLGGQAGLGAAWLYQVTVPVQPGNSGGPLVDYRGLVVGVIVAKLRTDRLGEDGVTPENVNFAVKSVELRRVLRGRSLSSAKAARNRQAAIARTKASVCHVVATVPPTTPPSAPDAPTSPPREAAPAPPPPPPPTPALREQRRVDGESNIFPDLTTVNAMRRTGTDEIEASLSVCVAADGAVTAATVRVSSGYPDYDRKLTATVGRWRYSPRDVGAPAAPMCRIVVFRYRLTDRPPTSGAAPGQVPGPSTGP